MYVIVLVCLLEINHCLATLSYFPCAFCFFSALVKFTHEFLTLFERLVQLISRFPSWFHTIWFYWSHAFHSFLSQIILCFLFGSKDMITVFTCLPSYRYSIFTMWTYLWIVGGIQSYCQCAVIKLTQRMSLLVSHSQTLREATSLPSENKMAAIHVVQIHTHVRFPWSKMADSSRTGNAQASQQSIFRENHSKFSTFIHRWEGYYRLWHE